MELEKHYAKPFTKDHILYEMSRIGKSIETESSCQELGEGVNGY